MTNRWVIRLEAEDGATTTFGSWRTADTASHLADKLRAASSHYSDVDGPEVAVTVERVERWPGLKKMLAEWSA